MNIFSGLMDLFARAFSPGLTRRHSGGGYGGPSHAGFYVTAERALTHDVVFACVRYISQTAAQATPKVRRWLPGGLWQELDYHPADLVLNWQPNPNVSGYNFRCDLFADACVHGNGFAEIERDAAGRPLALWRLHPRRVQGVFDANGVLNFDYTTHTGGTIRIPGRNMLHLRGLALDPESPMGASVMDYAAEQIGWAKSVQLFGSSLMSKGAHLTHVVEAKGKLTPEALTALRSEFQRLYVGREGSRTAFLDAGMSVKRLGLTPEEGQFLETMQAHVAMITRWFGVPPHKIGDLMRATNNNIETQSTEVLTDTIMPWLLAFEGCAVKLVGERSNLKVHCDVNDLLRGDPLKSAQRDLARLQSGAVTPNELRLQNGLNPSPVGDQFFVMSNLALLTPDGMRLADRMPAASGTDAPSPELPPAAPADPPPAPAASARIVLDPALLEMSGHASPAKAS